MPNRSYNVEKLKLILNNAVATTNAKLISPILFIIKSFSLLHVYFLFRKQRMYGLIPVGDLTRHCFERVLS